MKHWLLSIQFPMFPSSLSWVSLWSSLMRTDRIHLLCISFSFGNQSKPRTHLSFLFSSFSKFLSLLNPFSCSLMIHLMFQISLNFFGMMSFCWMTLCSIEQPLIGLRSRIFPLIALLRWLVVSFNQQRFLEG